MGASTLGSRAIIGEFFKRLEQNPGVEWVDATSMLFTSDQESETYNWLGHAAAMREWDGGRIAKGFRENGITIKNLEYEATMEVLVKELRRDKTGQILTRVREMADRTNAHWAKLLSILIINGESTVCYDDQFFYDTDHLEGDSGTQSNDIIIDISTLPVQVAGTTTAPSVEEMQLAILKTVQQMLGFVDDQGEPMNENARDFVVMVPVSFWHSAKAAVRNPVVDASQTSMVPVMDDVNIRVAVNPRLTWTDKFTVFRSDGSVKPFIRQQETEVTIKAIAEGSELEFNENKHHYGVETNRNVGYGYWQHACLSQFV